MQRSKLAVKFLFQDGETLIDRLLEFREIVPEKGNVVVDLVQAIFDEVKSRNDTGQLGRRRFLIWRLDGRKWDEARNKNFVLVHGNLLVWNRIIFHQRSINKFVELVGNRIKNPVLRNRNLMLLIEPGSLVFCKEMLTNNSHGKDRSEDGRRACEAHNLFQREFWVNPVDAQMRALNECQRCLLRHSSTINS